VSNRVVFDDPGSISRYISETMQAIVKVNIECEYEVMCELSDGVVSSDLG